MFVKMSRSQDEDEEEKQNKNVLETLNKKQNHKCFKKKKPKENWFAITNLEHNPAPLAQ